MHEQGVGPAVYRPLLGVEPQGPWSEPSCNRCPCGTMGVNESHVRELRLVSCMQCSTYAHRKCNGIKTEEQVSDCCSSIDACFVGVFVNVYC